MSQVWSSKYVGITKLTFYVFSVGFQEKMGTLCVIEAYK